MVDAFLQRPIRVRLLHLRQLRRQSTGQTAKDRRRLLGRRRNGRRGLLVDRRLAHCLDALVQVVADLLPHGDAQLALQFGGQAHLWCEHRTQCRDLLFDAWELLANTQQKLVEIYIIKHSFMHIRFKQLTWLHSARNRSCSSKLRPAKSLANSVDSNDVTEAAPGELSDNFSDPSAHWKKQHINGISARFCDVVNWQ